MACILSECWFGGQDVRGGGRLQLQGARQHHSTRQAASLSLCGLQRLRHSAPRQAAKVWPPCGARWVPQRRLPLSGAAPFSTAQTPRSSSLPRHPSKPKVDPKPSSPLAATPSAGGCRGQPRQHQLPHPRRERPLHPQGCAPSSACPALCGWSYSLPCRSVAVVGQDSSVAGGQQRAAPSARAATPATRGHAGGRLVGRRTAPRACRSAGTTRTSQPLHPPPPPPPRPPACREHHMPDPPGPQPRPGPAQRAQARRGGGAVAIDCWGEGRQLEAAGGASGGARAARRSSVAGQGRAARTCSMREQEGAHVSSDGVHAALPN